VLDACKSGEGAIEADDAPDAVDGNEAEDDLRNDCVLLLLLLDVE
jgi:hypothetical protein